jgi:hypothetical protein
VDALPPRLDESKRYAKLLVTANVLFSLFNPTEAEMASVTIGLQSFQLLLLRLPILRKNSLNQQVYFERQPVSWFVVHRFPDRRVNRLDGTNAVFDIGRITTRWTQALIVGF